MHSPDLSVVRGTMEVSTGAGDVLVLTRSRRGKVENYLGQDSRGRQWFRAGCGHPARKVSTARCKSCPRSSEKSASANRARRKHAHYIGHGKNRYLAPCGHAVGAPSIKQCWSCYKKSLDDLYEARGFVTTPYLTTTRDGKKVQAHRVIVEKALGRPFRTNEVVHHINCNKRDNRNCNLLVCDRAYHAYLHSAMQRKYGEMCNPPLQRDS